MVKHDILVRGVDLGGSEQKPPVLLQMNDDDFPARFLQDLASPGEPQISKTFVVTDGTLQHPIQRVLHVALSDLRCNTLGFPRVDPTRVISAGLVIRRCFRQPGVNGGAAYEDTNTLAAWMSNPPGQFQWVRLRPDQERLDPDPTKRKQLHSGQPALDAQLAKLALAVAYTESSTPAFAAPPATCSEIDRTVFYGIVPTASGEVSDTPPVLPPAIDRSGLLGSLPPFLRSSQGGSPPAAPAPVAKVDFRWMTDDFLNMLFPPSLPSSQPLIPTPNPQVRMFQDFSLALRMLHTVFGAFDGTQSGNQILAILNGHNVHHGSGTQRMGDFLHAAKTALLDYSPSIGTSPASAPTVAMPTSWDGLTNADESNLLDAMTAALAPRAQSLLTPQGRFQDPTRLYRLRFFFRVKGENPGCPPELVWSPYSEPFRIAAWYEGGQRVSAPIPLPDPAMLKNAKPNCSFQVPGSLMGAMQGSTLSGLMGGAGGGGGLSLGWICGFNLPLITICAFFVLNIFLSLLNIIFFWLPFIKICIPFPMPSSSSPDEGAP